jgi:hypothetical protein
MKRILLAAIVPVVLSTTACGSFYAEAEQPRVCIQLLSPQVFPVIPPGLPGGPGTFDTVVDVGLSNAIPDFILEGSPDRHILTFLSLTMSLQGAPGANLGWLTRLEVQAQSGTSTPVTLVDYVPGTPVTSNTLTVSAQNPGQNLVALLQNGGLNLTVSGDYDPARFPSGTTALTANVSACFSAKVKKTLEEMINGN